jgi:uncharacterized cupredoxin-like copper-binding protein
MTKENVIATLTLNEVGFVITSGRIDLGDGLHFTKEYGANVSGEVVDFAGKNGFTGNAEVTITRIDKTPASPHN